MQWLVNKINIYPWNLTQIKNLCQKPLLATMQRLLTKN